MKALSLLPLLLLLGPSLPGQPGEARIRLVERLAPCVVSVMSLKRPGGGSGVIIDERGTVLTNFHVVMGSLRGSRPGRMKCGLPGGRLVEARVVGIDPGGDLAVLRIQGRKGERFPWAPLGSEKDLEPGDFVLAMGNPFLLATDFTPTVTLGIVSGLRRYLPGRRGMLVYPDCVQTDAAVNPGNSGGPLFDGRGRVAGINGRISIGPRGRVNAGVGFAVSADLAKRFLPDMLAGKACAHGSLRVDAREVEGERGLLVAAIEEDGPAWKAGIREGDFLLAMDGRPFRGQNDLLQRISSLPAGWGVALSWRKGTEKKTRLSWVRLAPVVPLDPKLASWEPEEVDRILDEETERAQALAFRGLGLRPAKVRPPAPPLRGKVVRGNRALVEKLRPPESVLPSRGACLPPFPPGSEFDGGEGVEGRTALVILLPGNRDERLFLDAETGLPLGTAFSPDPDLEEVRILVKRWRRAGGIPVPARVVWKQGCRILLEEVFSPPRRKKR